MTMKTSIKGLIELAGHEGLCLSPYLDSVGVWTIGIGATRSEIPGLSAAHKDITIAEAIDLFKKSIVKYENAVNKALKVEVLQTQFDALVSICYNIGTGGTSGSTFVRRINNKSPVGSVRYNFMEEVPDGLCYLYRTDPSLQYEEQPCIGLLGGGTIVDAILMWRKPSEILGRRKKEATLFAKGAYANDGKCLVFPVSSGHKPVYRQGKVIKIEDYL